jgi:hypothetical protein
MSTVVLGDWSFYSFTGIQKHSFRTAEKVLLLLNYFAMNNFTFFRVQIMVVFGAFWHVFGRL